MASNYTSLNDFVYPIPICQPEADLGSILNIFQHLNCKMLAIPQNCGGWGIISSEDLLSLLAEVWLGKQTLLLSHPRKVASQQNIAHITTQDFNSLIKPAIVYQADTEIHEFLNHLEHGTLSSNQSEYLVVNTSGELQGRLDQAKIINYLTLEAKQRSRNTSQLPTSFDRLSNLINTIALPLKIIGAEGQDLYQNKSWQQLIQGQSRLHSAMYETNLQKMTWEKTEQRSLSQITTVESDIEIEETANWNYLKFPLVDEVNAARKCGLGGFPHEQLSQESPVRLGRGTVHQQQFPQINNQYWLVLATKAALPKPPEFQATSILETPEAVTNNLLATVSHELKSPLTGIVGLSRLLQEQTLGELNQRQARYVQLIHSSGQKMMGIIEDLLTLTSFSAEQLLEPELVNLEFLCRQLYQQALTKIQPDVKADSDLEVIASGLELQIELGSEIAIANKLLLSCVLSHLILETMRVSESLDQLNIKISNLSGFTAIAISSTLTNSSSLSSPPESPDSSGQNSGLDLIIAEYLAGVLQGNISSTQTPALCQFTLMLPQNKISPPQCRLSDNSTTNSSSTPQKTDNRNLTILCLYPESEATDPETNRDHGSNFNLKNWSDSNEQQTNYQHRIIEADSLEQAHTLARIWQLDVIILDSYQIVKPDIYLRSLQESEYLAALPLITLDTKTTEAANQIEGLNVYPCLLPAKHCSVEDLMQVIQIATGK